MLLWIYLIFFTLLGASIGSFINVVVYRLPRGLSIVSPPSSCPRCKTRLAWYDNLPVLGWFLLGGRCRYCRKPISAEYPIVEAMTAIAFGGWYWVCYYTTLRPDFSGPGLGVTWIGFVVYLVMIGGLIAATIIDAKYYIIPLEITWVIAASAALLFPVAVLADAQTIQTVQLPPIAYMGIEGTPEERVAWVTEPYNHTAAAELAVMRREHGPIIVSALPLLRPDLVCIALGATLGLIIALVLLACGLLPRSFDEMEADHPSLWDEAVAYALGQPTPLGASAAEVRGAPAPPDEVRHEPTDQSAQTPPRELDALRGLTVESIDRSRPLDAPPAAEGESADSVAGQPILETSDDAASDTHDADLPETDPHAWLAHPHPRREVLKECGFLCFPVAGAVAGYLLTPSSGAWVTPLIQVIAGVVFGYLVGGGMIWLTRVGGTLAFGKEAMGLGDVHLLAAIGAVTGWQVAVITFFMAPFFGLVWAAGAAALGTILHRRVRVIPYGPHLAAAALVTIVFREFLVEHLGRLFAGF